MKHSIVITGAGSGLGRGLSEQLAAAGHHIIATDLNFESAEETVTRIQAAGGEAKAYALDVRSEETVTDFWRRIAELPVSVLTRLSQLEDILSLYPNKIGGWF
jgi:3-hydroxybutyrate dehydrogenase